MADKSSTNDGDSLVTNGHILSQRGSKKAYNKCKKKNVAPSIRWKNFGVARQADDEQQASLILDKMSHLKKFSSNEGDDENLFVQWADDITDTLSGLWCTGIFLKLLISSALSGRAKEWFDSTLEGIDDNVVNAYTLEKFLSLLSEEFDGAKLLRRERFTKLLRLPIDSEKSLETFSYISEHLTPYYLSTSAALDLFLTKLEPQFQKKLENSVFPMTLDMALLMTACEFAKRASSHRKDRKKNTSDFDIGTSKKRATNLNKKCKTKIIRENNTNRKSNRKKCFSEKELLIPDLKRRKQSECGIQFPLVVPEHKEFPSERKASVNVCISKNGQSNLSNPPDFHAYLKDTKSQQYADSATSNLINNRLISCTATDKLIGGKVVIMKNENTAYNEPTDGRPSSLENRNRAVKENTLQFMSSNSFKECGKIHDSRTRSISGGNMTISSSQTMHMFSRPGSLAIDHQARNNEVSMSNRIKVVDNYNPFTANLKVSKSSKNVPASMRMDDLSGTVGLKNALRTTYEENESYQLSSKKSYPLNNFAVRTRNAHFNDRPSNYTSAHAITSVTYPSSSSISTIQCFTRPNSKEPSPKKVIISSCMVAQKKELANTKSKEAKNRSSFNEVTNPFLVNVIEKNK